MTSSTGSAPRRVDFPEGLPVGLSAFIVSGKGRMMNLSASGAYVATPMYLLPQARVKLKIVLREEKRWVETDAVVVWENRGTVGRRDGLPPGYGFRFVDTPADARKVIARLLGRVVATAPAPVEPVERGESPEITVAPSSKAPSSPSGRMLVEDEPEGPPFRLKRPVVERRVPKSPGIFVLSYDRTQETRVGRSDVDLRRAVASFEGTYAYFYFEVIDAEDERFFRECELFHRLGGDRGQLDNEAHPEPPEGVDLGCPVCVTAKMG